MEKKAFKTNQNYRAIIDEINMKRDVRASDKNGWKNLHEKLVDSLITDELLNDNEVIKVLLNYAYYDFDDRIIPDILDDFSKRRVGYKNALWISSHSLSHEKNQDYVKAINIYNSCGSGCKPASFLEIKFREFKKRMKCRLDDSLQMYLGSLNNIHYTYENGLISATQNGRRVDPQINILKIIEYQKPKEYSFQKSSEIPGYNVNIVFSEGISRTFIEARLEADGIDYVALRKSRNNDKEKGFQRSGKEPPSTSAVAAMLSNQSDQVKGILKNQQSLFTSPRSVKLMSHSENIFDKNEPIVKSVLVVGETIKLKNGTFYISSKLGNNSFLCKIKDGSSEYVFKKLPEIVHNFNPVYKYLFCLPDTKFPEFFVTQYIPVLFRDAVKIMHKKKFVDEELMYFILLQLVRILNDLESNKLTHGNITMDNLAYRPGSSVVLPNFNDDTAWTTTGICLTGMDKMIKDHGSDRESVKSIFYFLSTRSFLQSNQNSIPAPVKKWNKKLWELAFSTLNSSNSLNNLEEEILKMLFERGARLKSTISRVNILIHENIMK